MRAFHSTFHDLESVSDRRGWIGASVIVLSTRIAHGWQCAVVVWYEYLWLEPAQEAVELVLMVTFCRSLPPNVPDRDTQFEKQYDEDQQVDVLVFASALSMACVRFD